MNIKVTINKFFEPDDRLRAVASACFDNDYVLHGIMVYENNAGVFVVLPHKEINGQKHETFHAINKTAWNALVSAVIEEYNLQKKQ